MKDLNENHESDYRNYLQVDDDTFSYLLKKVGPRLKRKDTKMSKATTGSRHK